MHSWIGPEDHLFSPHGESLIARGSALAGGAHPFEAVIETQTELASIAISPEGVMKSILAGVHAMAKSDGARLEVILEEGASYRSAAGVFNAPNGPDGAESKSVCRTVGTLQICDDAETDLRVDRDACQRLGIRALVRVPLPPGGPARGALEVVSSRCAAFDDRMVWGLRLLAGLLASSMSHAIQVEARQRLLDERTLALTALSHRVHHDPLTGMPNRLCFDDRLAHALALSRRNKRKSALIVLDIDHFKEINDTLGHPVGDVVLQQFSTRLREQLRESDTLARIGGDEFMIVLPELTDAAGAVTVAGKLIDCLRAPFTIGVREVQATCSMGIAVFPDHGNDATTLQKQADEQLYVTKRKGRNGYSMDGKGKLDS